MQVHPLRDRERDRGDMFRAGDALVRLPGYPEEWRDRVPRADGRPGERDTTHFGPEWIRAERVRELKVQADALCRFAQLVASKTGNQTSLYLRMPDGGQAMLDMLITNVVTDVSPMASTGSFGEEDRRALDYAFSLVNDYASQQRKERFAQGLQQVSREDILRRPSQQQEWERLVRQADRQRAEARGGGAVPIPPAAGSRLASSSSSSMATPAPPPPPPAPQGASGIPSGGETPARPRPIVTISTATPAEHARMEEARSAPSGGKSAIAPDGSIVFGVDDKWIMLLRLMLRDKGITETDLKAWGILYNTASAEFERRLIEDPAARAQYIKDLSTVRSLLQQGHGGRNWVNAVQHTGWIQFTEQFAGAVEAAASEVRNFCHKPWATDLALMTNEHVKVYFASLVACHIQEARSMSYSRYGGGQGTDRKLNRDHDALRRLFSTRLRKDASGFLVIDGQYSPGGDAQRIARAKMEQKYTEETGMYLTDANRF